MFPTTGLLPFVKQDAFGGCPKAIIACTSPAEAAQEGGAELAEDKELASINSHSDVKGHVVLFNY